MSRGAPFLLLVVSLPVAAYGQEVIPWQDAAKYYGETKTVEGTVVATRNTGKVCFLNFSPNWRTDFTAVIFASDFDKFAPNPEQHYRGKKVRVTGKIEEYQGKPEIILKSPRQIVVVEAEGSGRERAFRQVEATPRFAARQSMVSLVTADVTVYVTRTGAKYHRAGCRSLSRSMIPMPLSQAAVRYGPCGNCRPPAFSGSAGSGGAAASTAPVPSFGERCQAITKKGTQCSRRAQAGGAYCWQHQR